MMLMDSGVVCDGTLLHWGNLLKVYTHSKTCKPRMSGILFSFGNSQFKICFIFMLILLLNIRLAVRHLWSPKMLGYRNRLLFELEIIPDGINLEK